MLKNKLKVLVQNQKELPRKYLEILNGHQTTKLTGGCRVLNTDNCKTFNRPSCGHLLSNEEILKY